MATIKTMAAYNSIDPFVIDKEISVICGKPMSTAVLYPAHPNNGNRAYLMPFARESVMEIDRVNGLLFRVCPEIKWKAPENRGELVNKINFDDIDQRDYAYFTLKQHLGCCGIAVLSGMQTSYGVRRKGLGNYMFDLAIKCATARNYTTLLTTTIDGVSSCDALLKKFDMKRVFGFKNVNTHNNLSICVRDLQG